MIGSDQTPGGGPEGTPPSAEPTTAATPEATPATAAPAVKKPGAIRRTWEWFWRGRVMAELRKEYAGSPRGAEFLRRAWLALEVAKRTLDPPERFPSGAPDAVAWDVSRQAVYWGVRAERLLATGEDDPTLRLESMIDAARPRLLAAAGGESELAALEPALAGRTLSEQSELPPEEQSRSAHAMFRFARSLLLDLEAPRVRVDRLWFQRLYRCGGLLVLFALLGFGVLKVRQQLLHQRDVAYLKPWRTSSVYTATTACPSPQQQCAESPFFFFHTLEDDRPWLEIDLEQKVKITGAVVENREDCCADRAVPLAILVSTDRKNWREVARRTETFGTWSPTFAPASARWVRIQTMKRATLHLHRVRVLR